MRHLPIDPALFIENRARLVKLLAPSSLAAINANDILPTNADGQLPMVPQSDLFYLTGVEQEESILLLAPQSFDEKLREVLFVRETSDLLATWEGHKLTKEEATAVSGIKNVKWLAEFPGIFHRLMLEAQHVYLNSNEHARTSSDVQSRDARFIAATMQKYPLHNYRRLAPLMHQLRAAKTEREIELLRTAVEITADGFERAARFIKPGVMEYEVEAEFAHEFIRRRARFAYTPIIASGKNANVLHYNQNDQECKKGDLVLLDVAASYANYNADLTRTLPVSGKFSRRQRDVYNAVLRVLRASIKNAVVGKLHRDWTKEAQAQMNEELLQLGLLKKADIKKQTEDEPACRKYFMHGLGHFLGLDVHDVGYTSRPFEPGTVLTVEPGIYIKEEGFGIRLENNIVVRSHDPGSAEDLMATVPLEPDEIEDLMAQKR